MPAKVCVGGGGRNGPRIPVWIFLATGNRDHLLRGHSLSSYTREYPVRVHCPIFKSVCTATWGSRKLISSMLWHCPRRPLGHSPVVRIEAEPTTCPMFFQVNL